MNQFTRLVPSRIKRPLRSRLEQILGVSNDGAIVSYSQEGEDLVLARLFAIEERTTPGFYVDVGAHHPTRYSNTYYFYRRKWTGINLDPLPGSMISFKEMRPLDLNLELAISDTQKTLTYYEFNEPALNGFSEELSRKRDNHKHFKLTSSREIQTHRLIDVLDCHLSGPAVIDFLTVDVEGHDLSVLKSNDWKKYRPKMVLAEDAEVATVSDAQKSQIAIYMTEQGYELLSKTALTLFFAASEFILTSPTGVRIA